MPPSPHLGKSHIGVRIWRWCLPASCAIIDQVRRNCLKRCSDKVQACIAFLGSGLVDTNHLLIHPLSQPSKSQSLSMSKMCTEVWCKSREHALNIHIHFLFICAICVPMYRNMLGHVLTAPVEPASQPQAQCHLPGILQWMPLGLLKSCPSGKWHLHSFLAPIWTFWLDLCSDAI